MKFTIGQVWVRILDMAKKFYITTAIDYVNAPRPHIGHALEKLQADVLARFHRFIGDEVFYLTGSDENAQKNVLAAEEARMPVKEFIDRNIVAFLEMINLLDISNNDYIRTANKEIHFPGVVKLWQACERRGDIYKKEYAGLYCVGCEAFVTEKDLEKGLCPEHLKAPEKVAEENYFFRLSRYQKKLKKIIESDILEIVPEIRKNELLRLINSGLEDFSISRPKERVKNWGVPVPGDENQIIYVWFDALANYITALGYGTEDEKKFAYWWPADIQVIGKGITRFHAVYWPAMLLSAGIRLPKKIFAHGYLTVDGQKISKTLGNTIDPNKLVKKYGTDPVRYFLLREFSPFEDGDFSLERFEERYHSDLSKGLGNFASRVLTMAERKFGQQEINCSLTVDPEFKKRAKDVLKEIKQKIKEFRFNDALTEVWRLIGENDQYIEREKVWEQENEKYLKNLLFSLSQIALFLEIFLPQTAKNIFTKLGIEENKKSLIFRVNKGEPLFPRLEN